MPAAGLELRALSLEDVSSGAEEEPDLHRAVAHNHRANATLWNLEDQSRREDIPDSRLAALKRTIDVANRVRHGALEQIDAALERWLRSSVRSLPVQSLPVRSLPVQSLPVQSLPVRLPEEGDGSVVFWFNSESPGSMLDRRSILCLRADHLRRHLERSDASDPVAASDRELLAAVEAQLAALTGCLAALLRACEAGRACWLSARAHKLYHDPRYRLSRPPG